MVPVPTFIDQLSNGYLRSGYLNDDALILAVSGGGDSMALLHGTMALWPDSVDRVVVVHVNHQLRGAESIEDADYVLHECRMLGVNCVVRTADVEAARGTVTESVEAAARRLRYEQLCEVATEFNCRLVVTAHHQQDQAETILHHVIRGTGIRGLQGMSRSRPLNENTHLIRPMLDIELSTIEQFLADEKRSFRTDSTNMDSAFTRNRIRNQLLPLLQSQFNPLVIRRLAGLSQQANETVECLDHFSRDLLDGSLLERQSDSCRLDVQELHSLPVALVRHLMTMLWTRQAWPRQKMNLGHWNDLAKSVVEGMPVAKDLPHGVRFERKPQMMHIYRTR